ncbi:hypothetical protein [Hymenobacter sp. DG01]|uniref:hypothetical protein n=1 Tax=Hymenobacter sp. DG01 TaxID=2584940 RepID=UPI00111F19C5|nr:hypothetical protein [Hymenobacter sp. DG01]
MFSLTIIFYLMGLQYIFSHQEYSSTKITDSKNCFTVIKIDSITSYILSDLSRLQNGGYRTYDGIYIIYAKKGNKTYRVITDKIRYNYRKNIYTGNCYEFNLKSYFDQGSKEPVDLELAQAQGITINNIYIKRSVDNLSDIFYDQDLEGLYLKKIKDKN